MHRYKRLSVKLLAASILLGLAGCADYNWKMPGVYRIPVQQGTVVEQSMVAQLKPGMAKDQVKYIMGSPVIVDPFHSNRWEYIYTFQSGSAKVREQRHITLHFNDNEKLAYIDGDIVIGDPNLRAEAASANDKQPESFVVPERSKPGLFGRIIGADPSFEIPESDKTSTSESDSDTEEEPVSQEKQENIEVIEEPAGDGAGGI